LLFILKIYKRLFFFIENLNNNIRNLSLNSFLIIIIFVLKEILKGLNNNIRNFDRNSFLIIFIFILKEILKDLNIIIN